MKVWMSDIPFPDLLCSKHSLWLPVWSGPHPSAWWLSGVLPPPQFAGTTSDHVWTHGDWGVHCCAVQTGGWVQMGAVWGNFGLSLNRTFFRLHIWHGSGTQQSIFDGGKNHRDSKYSKIIYRKLKFWNKICRSTEYISYLLAVCGWSGRGGVPRLAVEAGQPRDQERERGGVAAPQHHPAPLQWVHYHL